MARVFRTHHGTMLTADKPSGLIVANPRGHDDPRAWQKFTVEPIDGTDKVSIRTSFGTYVEAHGGGGQGLTCTTTALGDWGHWGFWIRPDGRVALQASNKQWVRVGAADEDYAVTVTKNEAPEDNEEGAYEIFAAEEVADEPGSGPGTIPGVHPDPVVGRIRTRGNECFVDDSGPRNFAVVHAGDTVARWMYGGRDQVLADLDDMAAAGYHIVRAWWHLGVNHAPWNAGGSPHYPGVDVFETPNYVQQGIELAHAVAARGMRIAIGSGGIARMDSQQERDMARIFRQVIDGAGPDAFAWAEGVNEPSSTHATSDNDGDNQTANLSALTRIMTEGTDLLFHGGYWTANNYKEDAKHQLQGQRYSYVHGWRGGNVFNKIDRRFTWCRIYANETGRHELRLTIDGESVGWPTDGRPLRYVSATESRHEMNSHEALGLIAAATAVRGIPSHMSGTGVQRFQPFTETVGWRQIPWIVAQLPKDVATFGLYHGGQSDGRVIVEATTNGSGVLARADQAIDDSGRFAAILYNQHANNAQSFRFRRTATFRVYDVEQMSISDERTVQAGQRLDLSMFWGRVLIGRAV